MALLAAMASPAMVSRVRGVRSINWASYSGVLLVWNTWEPNPKRLTGGMGCGRFDLSHPQYAQDRIG